MHPYTYFACYRPQRSWGKVIFSEACVKNSVHRGGVHGREVHGAGHAWQGECVWWGACVTGGMCDRGHAWQGGAWRGACMAGGHVWWGEGMHAMPPPTPRDVVGQCAGGTHPTGMHSSKLFLVSVSQLVGYQKREAGMTWELL